MKSIIKTMKNRIKDTIYYPRTLVEAIVSLKENKTLQNILDDKIDKNKISHDLTTTNTDMVLGADVGPAIIQQINSLNNNLENKYYTLNCKSSSVKIGDARAKGLVLPEQLLPLSMSGDLASGSDIGLPIDLYYLISIKPWHDETAASLQIAINLSDTSTYMRNGRKKIWSDWTNNIGALSDEIHSINSLADDVDFNGLLSAGWYNTYSSVNAPVTANKVRYTVKVERILQGNAVTYIQTAYFNMGLPYTKPKQRHTYYTFEGQILWSEWY